MAVRVIYYTNEELIEHGDLELRRKSAVYSENSFEHENLFRLDELKQGWRFSPLQEGVVPLFHDEKLISGPIEIKNGFTFNSAECFYKIVAEFPKAPPSAMNKLLFRITALLTALILIAEAILVIWLPKELDRRKDLEKKVVVQKCGKSIDRMRGQLRNWQAKKKDLTGPAVVFTLKRLNQIAEYFRANRDFLTMEEVLVIRERLEDYQGLIDRFEKGINFDQRVEPDVEGWIDKNCKVGE